MQKGNKIVKNFLSSVDSTKLYCIYIYIQYIQYICEYIRSTMNFLR